MVAEVKVVSWNINSLRLRLPLLAKFVALCEPDIVCLQEIKVEDALFPLAEVKALGFEYVVFSGEKSYNGVAILSRLPLANFEAIDVEGYGHKRHVAVDVGCVRLHNFYIPAGGDEPDVLVNEKFAHKLKFLDWMDSYFAPLRGQKKIIVGDFNIAPFENDVWSHKQLLKVVSHTPIEVEKLNAIRDNGGFVDTHRMFVDEGCKLYSWWSYRGRDVMKSNRGRRLDHIWVDETLRDAVLGVESFVDFRVEKQPSDHIPILTKIFL